jgi:phosphoglycerate dehydrogenase-like enzyme
MKMINTLFLTCSHFNPTKDELDLLGKTYPQLRVVTESQEKYTQEQISAAEILVGFPKPGDLQYAKNLKWLQTPSSGVQQYANRSLYCNPEILLTNASGTYGRQISDHVIGMIIALNHGFLTYHDQMKTSKWERHYPLKDLWDSTILILGFGDIGQHVAKKAKAHDMQVIALKRTAIDKPSYVDEICVTKDLDQALPKADYVVACLASTSDTDKLLDARRIALMKEGSYLINVARGGIVDQDAVIAALRSGHLAGACFDALSPEPLPPENPLWAMDNVLITPHSSGLSLNDPKMVFSLFFDNLSHYMGDKNLTNPVDFDRNY